MLFYIDFTRKGSLNYDVKMLWFRPVRRNILILKIGCKYMEKGIIITKPLWQDTQKKNKDKPNKQTTTTATTYTHPTH